MKLMRVVYLFILLIAQHVLVHGDDSLSTDEPVGISTDTGTTNLETDKQTSPGGETDSINTMTDGTSVETATPKPSTTTTTSTRLTPSTTPRTTTQTEAATTEKISINTTTVIIRTVRPTPNNPTWKIVGGLAGGLAGLGLIGMIGGIYICYKGSNGHERGQRRGRDGSQLEIQNADF